MRSRLPTRYEHKFMIAPITGQCTVHGHWRHGALTLARLLSVRRRAVLPLLSEQDTGRGACSQIADHDVLQAIVAVYAHSHTQSNHRPTLIYSRYYSSPLHGPALFLPTPANTCHFCHNRCSQMPKSGGYLISRCVSASFHRMLLCCTMCALRVLSEGESPVAVYGVCA